MCETRGHKRADRPIVPALTSRVGDRKREFSKAERAPEVMSEFFQAVWRILAAVRALHL